MQIGEEFQSQWADERPRALQSKVYSVPPDK